MRNFSNEPIVVIISISVGSAMISLFLFNLGLFSNFELGLEDLLFSPRPIHPDILILAIDDESLEKIGQWPWPREVFAEAIAIIAKAKPKSVGIDVQFSETSRLGEKDDIKLREAFKKSAIPIVLPIEGIEPHIDKTKGALASRHIKPAAGFLSETNISLGHINMIADSDGIIRRLPIQLISSDTAVYPSFSEAVLKSGKLDYFQIKDQEKILRIAFSAPPGSVRTIPFYRISEEDIGNKLKDKIIFVGATAADLHDRSQTPVSRGIEMSGVEIHAQIANMLIMGHKLAPMSWGATAAWIFFASIATAFAFYFFKRILKPIVIIGIFFIAQLVLVIILFENGVAANIIHLSLAVVLSSALLFFYRYFTTEKDRRRVRSIFEKYVSPNVLQEILQNPKAISLGGEERIITVLFSDIRGFTKISEGTRPKDLVGLLNRYFNAVSRAILIERGVLDKYIGDAIMAFWGAPIADDLQADRAIRAAKEMLSKLKKLNEDLKMEGVSEIKIGIGIFTGPAVVGNIGSLEQMDYTAIGDTVNIASRLEGLTKEYNVSIIIGETTKSSAKGKYNFRDLGSVEIRGREKSLSIYELD